MRKLLAQLRAQIVPPEALTGCLATPSRRPQPMSGPTVAAVVCAPAPCLAAGAAVGAPPEMALSCPPVETARPSASKPAVMAGCSAAAETEKGSAAGLASRYGCSAGQSCCPRRLQLIQWACLGPGWPPPQMCRASAATYKVFVGGKARSSTSSWLSIRSEPCSAPRF